jgi:hypothetical protein
MGRHRRPLPVQFINNNEELKPVLTEDEKSEIVGNIISAKMFRKKASFFLYWIFGINRKKSAELAGYKPTYADKLVANYRKDRETRTLLEKVFDEFPEKYRMLCKARLVELAKIEEGALAEYAANPRLAIKHPSLLKHLKVAGGVLPQDDFVRPMDIDIGSIQLLIQNKLTDRDGNSGEPDTD